MTEGEKTVEVIDVEKIMGELRAEMPAAQAAWQAVDFEDMPMGGEVGGVVRTQAGVSGPFDAEVLEQNVAEAGNTWLVSFFRPLPDRGVKGFFKRVMRKLIRFCVEPITQEVSAFHRAAADALESLRRFVREQLEADRRRDRELAALRERVALLEEKLAQQERDGE